MDTFNYLSSIARTVMPKAAIPDSCFSLVIMYSDGVLDTVRFQNPPESITESKGVNYVSDSVLGRFEPVRMYVNSQQTIINFSVNYYWLEDSLLGINSIGSWKGIKDNVSKLRALLYPYDDGRSSGDVADTTTPREGAIANSPGAAETQSAENQAGFNLNAYNQFLGKLSPPPVVKLNYGDLYQGIPCILTGLSIEYRGPWNDASMASMARRLAAQTAVRFSSGISKAVTQVNQFVNPLTSLATALPPGFGGNGIVGTLVNALRSDKLFPFVTTVNVTLETNWGFGTQKTYNDIRSLGKGTTSGLAKIIENIPIVGDMYR